MADPDYPFYVADNRQPKGVEDTGEVPPPPSGRSTDVFPKASTGKGDEPESMFKQREGDQPLPVQNDHRDVQSQVIDDIKERREVGIKRYGTPLQPNNGRDALQDAYEEAIDLCMYLKQLIIERDLNENQ